MAARDQRRRPAARRRLGNRADREGELSAWPERTRLIVRKERPHPGAQLRFTDVDGHRYQAFLTDQDGDDLAALEVTHRLHARVEDRIAEARELGLARLPFHAFAANQTWLERTRVEVTARGAKRIARHRNQLERLKRLAG